MPRRLAIAAAKTAKSAKDAKPTGAGYHAMESVIVAIMTEIHGNETENILVDDKRIPKRWGSLRNALKLRQIALVFSVSAI